MREMVIDFLRKAKVVELYNFFTMNYKNHDEIRKMNNEFQYELDNYSVIVYCNEVGDNYFYDFEIRNDIFRLKSYMGLPAAVSKVFTNGKSKYISVEYLKSSIYDREQGPSKVVVTPNTREIAYYKYGKKHRNNGPALFFSEVKNNLMTITKEYYREGRKHNIYGPAEMKIVIDRIVEAKYYIEGSLLDELQWSVMVGSLEG